ncbi:MAG: isochorismatase family protein [Prolixibacteraceae bacterium]|jgi:nicotinamidase-related amidase|nr:isochorismatase family protein [Prolixibacteraceae bacterium]NLX28266.1 isochorismatase family protein [Bacteroidales bacterium]HNQ37734.1 isochorismatase family protein [Prolixibacteraceae bacterium]HOY50395.1 isochorismatase family protein [Prolixibacteraceae bacterium]
MRIGKEHTTGLVVDIQERLFPAMAGKEEFLRNTLILIKGLQVLGIPLVVTQQYTRGLGETLPEIREAIAGFSFLEKRDFSCCDEPAVLENLARLRTEQVILFGIESHVCVLQTALDLKEAGMVPIVVADAITSRSLNSLDLARERFRHEGIMMTSAEAILFEILRSSAAPEFKDISRLVK